MKICSRCGQEKVLSAFRTYYNGSGKTYKFCKDCESIEARRKYLIRLTALTTDQQVELDKINLLYEKRKAAGLEVPQPRGTSKAIKLVEEELNGSL